MEQRAYTDIDSQESTHWWFKGRRRIINSLLDAYAPKEARSAVDVGCCTGLNTALLKNRAQEVVGWDMSPLAIELAKKKNPEIDVRQMTFPEGVNENDKNKYSIVTLFDVLEHIQDDRAAIKAVEDLLEPGGVALITVPALPSLWTEHDKVLHHQRRYTRAALRELILKNTNLQVLNLNYFNFLLFFPVWIFRTAKKVFGIKTGAADDSMSVPKILNRILLAIFGSERFFVSWLKLPFGVSLFAVLRK